MTCETVNIVSEAAPGGYVVINKSDFDPAIHKPYEPSKPEGVGEDPNAPKQEGGSKSKGKSEK